MKRQSNRKRQAELGLYHAMAEIRRIINELAGLQQLLAMAADQLKRKRK